MVDKIVGGFQWLADGTTGDPSGLRRPSDGKEFPFSSLVSGGAVGISPISFSQSVSLASSGSMPTTPVPGPLAFAPDSSAAVDGSQVLVDLIANGVNVPTFSGFRKWDGSADWNNTNGVRNCVTFFRRGGANWYAINQEAGSPVEPVDATAVTLNGAAGGVTAVASTPFTVGANGAISGIVTVTPSANGGGGTFSPSSVNISAGTPTATFTYTPSSTGAKSITVTNSVGLSNPPAITYTVTAAPVAPGAPTSLTAGSPTSTSVALSWTAPASTGGAAITDYVVQYSPAGANTWTTYADGTSTGTTATVNGLSASTSYDFRVAAVNSAGTGSYSNTASATTSAGSSIVTLQNTNALTESSAGVWTASAGGYAARGNAGSAGLAGDGWVGMDYLTSTNGIQMVGLDAAAGTTDYAQMDFLLWIYTDGIYKAENNAITKVDSDGTGSATRRYRLRRSGAVLQIERSDDSGATWTSLHTFASTSSAKLYPVWFLASAGDTLRNPRAQGLS